MTGALEITQLPEEVQELLRQYMPTYNASNVLVLGGADHMRLVFLDTDAEVGKSIPRCAINVPYSIANGLVTTVRAVTDRRPS